MLVTSKLSIFYGIPLLELWLPKVHAKAKSCYWNPHHLAEQAVLSLTLLVTVCLPGSFRDARLAKAEQEGPNKISLFMNPRIQLCWRHLPRFFLAQQRRRNTTPVTDLPCFLSPEGCPFCLDPTCCLTEIAGQTDNTHWRFFLCPKSQKSLSRIHYYFILNHRRSGLRDFHVNSCTQGAHSEDTDRRTKD